MSSPTAPRGLRFALYSHDAVGLGHVRRNLGLAGALSGLGADILLACGAPAAGVLPRPPRCDLLVLPSLTKDHLGRYCSRHLALPLRDASALRAQVLRTALLQLDPDLLVVDKHPRGADDELVPALGALRRRGRARVVLGVRDVLDDPVGARQDWQRHGSTLALARWYDEVWVYGDASVHDPLAGLGPLPVPVRHTGYLAATPRPSRPDGTGPLVVATVGAGGDGYPVAAAVAAAELPPGHRAVVVTGPDMPPADRERVVALAHGREDVEVVGLVSGVDRLLDQAAAVVTMGGYNSVLEALARGLPTLVVPRVSPRREQEVRARALERLGLLDVLVPRQATPAAVGHWLGSAVRRGPVGVGERIDLGGLDRVPGMALELIHLPTPRSQHALVV